MNIIRDFLMERNKNMDKELNEDARTKQDLLYECNSLESRLSNEIVKNEHLEQQCKNQKEVIYKLKEWINIVQQNKDNKHLEPFISTDELDELLDILKEVSE